MESTHAAIIRVSKAQMLKWLQFEGGKIRSVVQDNDHLEPDSIELVIEHPDLPEVYYGDILKRIVPEYEIHTVGDGGYTLVERTKPRRIHIPPYLGAQYSKTLGKCFRCNTPTHWYDIDYQGYICSQECVTAIEEDVRQKSHPPK